METIINRIGLMGAKEAAEKLGVSMGFFRIKVSPKIGRYISGKKYFTEPELEHWLREQIGEANISKETE